MRTRSPLIASMMLIALMVALSAWAWSAIAPGARIAMHWDIHGHVNGFASKPIALGFAPLLALVLTALFVLWPRVEPRRVNLAASRYPYTAGWIGAVGVLAAVHVIVVMEALGKMIDVRSATLTTVSVLLIVLGNFLGKSRANFFVGVRTPWSLSSDLAWEKSNRITGWLMVLTGFAVLVALVSGPFDVAIFVMIVGTVGGALAGIVASYVYWKHDPDRHAGDGVLE
ncbi:MAG TPA: SdpI family protein [Rhizomicrobium sp.]